MPPNQKVFPTPLILGCSVPLNWSLTFARICSVNNSSSVLPPWIVPAYSLFSPPVVKTSLNMVLPSWCLYQYYSTVQLPVNIFWNQKWIQYQKYLWWYKTWPFPSCTCESNSNDFILLVKLCVGWIALNYRLFSVTRLYFWAMSSIYTILGFVVASSVGVRFHLYFSEASFERKYIYFESLL